jgi:hypothetical protein
MTRYMGIHFLSVYLFALSGCNKSKDAAAPYPVPPQAESFDNAMLSNTPKYVKEGTLRFETKDIEAEYEIIEKAVDYANGDILNKTTKSSGSLIDITLAIEVPSENFNELVNFISPLAINKFDEKRISPTEVDEVCLDIENITTIKSEILGRYTNLPFKPQEAQVCLDIENIIIIKSEILGRYTNLPFKPQEAQETSTNKSQDTPSTILAIEEKISDLIIEIDSLERKKRHLCTKDKLSKGYLTVVFYQKLDDMDFCEHFKNGLSNGLRGVQWVIIGISNIWPLFIVVALLIAIRTWFKNGSK